MTKLASIDKGTVKAYARWEPVYDLVFGELLAPGRRQAIELINQRSGSVLEVGVGTGISLPQYRETLGIPASTVACHAGQGARAGGVGTASAMSRRCCEMDAARMTWPRHRSMWWWRCMC